MTTDETQPETRPPEPEIIRFEIDKNSQMTFFADLQKISEKTNDILLFRGYQDAVRDATIAHINSLLADRERKRLALVGQANRNGFRGFVRGLLR